MKCVLCHSDEVDDTKLGQFLSSEGVTCHHFCLLFAPGLPQNGEDDEGLQGFLKDDIQVEAKRVKTMKCHYCGEPQANMGCCVRSCRIVYHLSCGFDNNASFIFKDPYETFCRHHSKKCMHLRKDDFKEKCGICLEKLVPTKKRIKVPCCKNLFHHSCLQKFASTSGSLFKCPLCNDTELCHEKLPEMGIYLPIKDADWEIELMEEGLDETVFKICDNPNCTDGTLFQDSPWLWTLCSTCGANAIHNNCNKNCHESFVCVSCSEMLEKKNELQPEESNVEMRSEEEESPVKLVKKRNFNSWMSDEELASSDDDVENVPSNIFNERASNKRKAQSLPESDFSDDSSDSPHRPRSKLSKVSPKCERRLTRSMDAGSSRRLRPKLANTSSQMKRKSMSRYNLR